MDRLKSAATRKGASSPGGVGAVICYRRRDQADLLPESARSGDGSQPAEPRRQLWYRQPAPAEPRRRCHLHRSPSLLSSRCRTNALGPPGFSPSSAATCVVRASPRALNTPDLRLGQLQPHLSQAGSLFRSPQGRGDRAKKLPLPCWGYRSTRPGSAPTVPLRSSGRDKPSTLSRADFEAKQGPPAGTRPARSAGLIA